VFEGITDDQGQFAFHATRHMDHAISVDSGDGHAASFIITAAELPASLPGTVVTEAAIPTPVPPAEAIPGDLHSAIDQSIARQIRPLREQLDAYQQKLWWHDVIGGLGYIIGVAGFAYGWAHRPQARRKPQAEP
jgi:nickel transport protein